MFHKSQTFPELNHNIFLDRSLYHHFAAHVIMKSPSLVDEINIFRGETTRIFWREATIGVHPRVQNKCGGHMNTESRP